MCFRPKKSDEFEFEEIVAAPWKMHINICIEGVIIVISVAFFFSICVNKDIARKKIGRSY